MSDDFFKELENAAVGSHYTLSQALAALRFNADGLLPVIAQCVDSDKVLMVAWMNRDSLQKTLSTGRMVYFSRSRQMLWQKGETSGNFQNLRSLYADCDGDVLLAKVKQTGGACHTNRRSCFYVQITPQGVEIIGDD
ncbi:MAG: phosphoribosyl-AMP cyclohydrolase [Gammaproteobacteria bacterium WSBS_2016_MAG_OTU1]